MSDKFNGFSQDDIKKMKTNPMKTVIASTSSSTSIKPAFREQRGGIRRMPDKMQTTKKQSQSITQNIFVNEEKMDKCRTAVNSTIDVNLDRSMSKSLEEALFFQPIRKSTNPATLDECKTNNKNSQNNSSILQLSEEADSSDSCIAFDDSILSAPTATNTEEQKLDGGNDKPQNTLNLDSPFRGISLKDFETHRKMIEEQNKQKKELLHKAIEQHSQKTAAEARKIEEIKSELSKLDDDLALDVAILRKQIDMACMHFTNMEKQYMKIETQFLKAKIELHNAAEKKELLTEHLCTVIAHNEDRKAQKLSELMQKVGLSSADDFEEPKSDMPTSIAQTVDK